MFTISINLNRRVIRTYAAFSPTKFERLRMNIKLKIVIILSTSLILFKRERVSLLFNFMV